MTNARCLFRPMMLMSVGLPLALAGCDSTSQDYFAPLCPKPTIMADAADLDLYRAGGAADPTDLSYAVRITGLNGSCKAGKARNTTGATISVSIAVNRGPSGAARTLTVPYFIAVVKDGRVLDKKAYAMDAQFSATTGTVALVSDPVDLVLPTPQGVSAADYRIVAGLQLTANQLERNRAAISARKN